MKECGICYETRLQRFLPCGHSVCHTCYENLQGDNCPYCRKQFRTTSSTQENRDPDYWMDYQRPEWIVFSRYHRSGEETIHIFRSNNVPDSIRRDNNTTVVRSKRFRRRRLRRN